jgi:hypothetical protein
MGLQAYAPLIISGFLEADLKHVLTGAGTDARIATRRLATMCEGNRGSSTPPTYEKSARTVWRVENDGKPPPEVSFFGWGGDVIGLPPMRIWYARQGNNPPAGLGAFPAKDDDVFPERAELEARAARVLKAPGCYFAGDEA